MKTGLALCVVAGLAILCAGAPAQTSIATISAASAQTTEWSAVKTRHHVHVHKRQVHFYRKPSYVYRAPSYGRVGDPSLGPDGRPYARPHDLGGCIFDEGYGRFSACPNR